MNVTNFEPVLIVRRENFCTLHCTASCKTNSHTLHIIHCAMTGVVLLHGILNLRGKPACTARVRQRDDALSVLAALLHGNAVVFQAHGANV